MVPQTAPGQCERVGINDQSSKRSLDGAISSNWRTDLAVSSGTSVGSYRDGGMDGICEGPEDKKFEVCVGASAGSVFEPG